MPIRSPPSAARWSPATRCRRRSAGTSSVTATLRAMESAGVVRTLAEPNLTAISGESATFIAGGEFPVPAGYSCDPVTRVCQHPDLVQEVRHFAQLHARGADRRPDQPARHDGSVGTVERQLDHTDAGPQRQHDELADHSLDQDPPRGNHAGNSVGRLDGDGRADSRSRPSRRSTACPGWRNCRFSARCSAAATTSTTRPN